MTTRFGCLGGNRYTGMALVMTIIFANSLRDAGTVRDTTMQALSLIFSQAMATQLSNLLATCPLPSASTLTRARLWVDIAHILSRQEDSKSILLDPKACYLKADSSPQVGKDWLMTKVREVRISLLTKLLVNVWDLVNSPLKFDETDLDVMNVWFEKSAEICNAFCTHTYIPVAIGSRRSSLRHKLSAIMWALYLESAGLNELGAFLRSVVAITTDQGTEAGLADVPRIQFKDLLPDISTDIEMDDDNGALTSVAPPPNEHIFQYAVFLPGLLHTVHNLTGRTLASLSLWVWYKPLLTALARFLSHSHHLDCFMAHCIPSNLRDTFTIFLDRSFEDVKEWRWGTIIKVLDSFEFLGKILRRFWNKAKFLHGDTQAADGEQVPLRPRDQDSVDINKVDEAIQSAKFWVYSSMPLKLQGVVEKLRSWAESCPCHGS
jgi:hypothetical protein